jgi:hypothetical protein
MNIGDIVLVRTGCKDCGDVQVKIMDLVDDRALVEIIGDLPHKISSRLMMIDSKHLRDKNE